MKTVIRERVKMLKYAVHVHEYILFKHLNFFVSQSTPHMINCLLLDPYPSNQTVLRFLWIIYVISVLLLFCFRARLFIYTLWSPAGKGLTSSLSFVMSNCEVVTFTLVSRIHVVLDCLIPDLRPLSFFNVITS